ncbi:hypothetical protein BR141012304_10488 [Brucella inopinata]|nr:hypothetical protein BR141012304_10488 [Brucella inopinata]
MAENTAFRSPRQKPGGKTVIGNRRLHVQPGAFKTAKGVSTHGGRSAEQMRAAGYVQHQPMRLIKGDKRRVALAPMGKALEKCGIVFWRCRCHVEPFHAGARIGQRHAGKKAEPCRFTIHCRQAQRIGRAFGHNQRKPLLAVRRNGAAKPVGRQKRKPEGEKQAFCRPVRGRQIRGFHCSIP